MWEAGQETALYENGVRKEYAELGQGSRTYRLKYRKPPFNLNNDVLIFCENPFGTVYEKVIICYTV